MTVRDVWQSNKAFRWVMTIIAGVGVSLTAGGIIGAIVLYGTVRANTELLQTFRTEVRRDFNQIDRDISELRGEYGERLRYLERRRGVHPGDP